MTMRCRSSGPGGVRAEECGDRARWSAAQLQQEEADDTVTAGVLMTEFISKSCIPSVLVRVAICLTYSLIIGLLVASQT